MPAPVQPQPTSAGVIAPRSPAVALDLEHEESGYVADDGASASAKLPRLAPNDPYLLMYHPDRWIVSDDMGDGVWQVIPGLAEMPLSAGVSLVTKRKRKDGVEVYETGPARLLKERRGYALLADAAFQPIAGGVRYLRRHAVAGGFVHLPAWVTPIPSSRRTTRRRGYVAWCRSLVDQGVIPEVDLGVLAQLEVDTTAARDARADKVATVPSYRVDMDRMNAALAAIAAKRAELEAA